MHCNSIDYHPVLDQILLSVHNFNEVWIIDHSTTTEEAKGHSGGNSGSGGDLLYRWGNPHAYQRGNEGDRVFNGQHDACWVEAGFPGEGQISVFNNNRTNGSDIFSSVDFFNPPLDSPGTYILEPGAAYGPASVTWTYDGRPNDPFHSIRLSGVQRLPNGNSLICSGNEGRFIEVTLSGDVVWEYISPLSGNTPVSQGQFPVLNDIFRARRYTIDYEGFAGRDLTPGDPIEANPLPAECPDGLSSAQSPTAPLFISAGPNPFTDVLTLTNPDVRLLHIDIFAHDRQIGQYNDFRDNNLDLKTTGWPRGLLVIRCTDIRSGQMQVIKLVKQ
jgi:hypothetical protein